MTFPVLMTAIGLLLVALLVAAFAAGRAVGYVAGIKYADGYVRRRLLNGGTNR